MDSPKLGIPELSNSWSQWDENQWYLPISNFFQKREVMPFSHRSTCSRLNCHLDSCSIYACNKVQHSPQISPWEDGGIQGLHFGRCGGYHRMLPQCSDFNTEDTGETTDAGESTHEMVLQRCTSATIPAQHDCSTVDCLPSVAKLHRKKSIRFWSFWGCSWLFLCCCTPFSATC